jgi:hypothetical protein
MEVEERLLADSALQLTLNSSVIGFVKKFVTDPVELEKLETVVKQNETLAAQARERLNDYRKPTAV